jgi:hypothetical protein
MQLGTGKPDSRGKMTESAAFLNTSFSLGRIWSGDTTTNTITIDANKTVTAAFTPQI